MSSMTSWGRSNCFPVRENRALFKGFQNPRNPSYFSNTHLIRHWSVKQDGWDVMGVKNYQLVGLMEELVKKQALMGSPISSTSLTCLSKNPGGGESLMGIPSSTFNIVWIRSGRCNLMLAAKLCVYHVVRNERDEKWGLGRETFRVVCPTNKEQWSMWFHSCLWVLVSFYLVLVVQLKGWLKICCPWYSVVAPSL